ncbi:MAG TPA: HIT family protein [Alphaproteobacteria bacterium]|nr:HIT family protein [Alphaproteobacteria bacterium]
MADCIICDRKFEKNILFENENIIIMLGVEPSVNGHIQIFPKQHFTILEQIPNDALNMLVDASNKVSMILFEVMKVHGTNIIISNGVPAGQKIPHFSIDIIPRRNDDSLKLDWDLKQASPESLDTIHRIINEANIPRNKSQIIDIEPIQAAPSQPKQPETPMVKMAKRDIGEAPITEEIKKTNYHHKIFERVP